MILYLLVALLLVLGMMMNSFLAMTVELAEHPFQKTHESHLPDEGIEELGNEL